jgi:hypothetical protein
MSQPESWFTGHTPNWPKDNERKTLVRISVKIEDERGLTQEQSAKICAKIERMVRGQAKTRIVSAVI